MASVVGFGALSGMDGTRRGRPPADGRGIDLSAFRNLGQARSVAGLIEGEIIPRLMAAHGAESIQINPMRGHAPADSRSMICDADIAEFAPLALEVDAYALIDHVERLLARGVTIDGILVDLLAPAARELGIGWGGDRCELVDGTMGLWRLQEVVRELSGRLSVDHGMGDARRVLFAALPGDQHSFGTVIVEEMFRRDGWDTEVALDPDMSELLEKVSRGWYDMVGLTVSCDCHIAPLPSIITALRSVSRNPQLLVMVGGRIFLQDPALADRVGADGTAADARLALRTAAGLVGALAFGTVACG